MRRHGATQVVCVAGQGQVQAGQFCGVAGATVLQAGAQSLSVVTSLTGNIGTALAACTFGRQGPQIVVHGLPSSTSARCSQVQLPHGTFHWPGGPTR